MAVNITWFVNEENEFEPINSYTADGAYTPGDYFEKVMRIYNNYNGAADSDSANNAKLVVAFKTYEDNFLLNLFQVSTDGINYYPLKIDIDRGEFELGTLTGFANSGQSESTNCKDIYIKIGPIPDNIKSNLKSVIFYLEYDK